MFVNYLTVSSLAILDNMGEHFACQYEVVLCFADDYAGFGNGFHATGGCGSKRAHMRQCLRLMHSIVSTYDDAVITDITEQGAINQLTCQFILLLLPSYGY